MSLRDRMYELTNPEEVTEFIAKYPKCAFFKAGSCHKTMQGFGHVEEALHSRDDIHLAFVRVIESRPVSNLITELTDVVHQSPQFILMIDGKPVYDVDNWDITPEALETALDQHLGPVEKKEKTTTHRGDVTPYIELLRAFLADEIDEQTFSSEWITTFKFDPTPRSKEECTLLQSLYGDPDAGLIRLNGPQAIKDKCSKILEALETTQVN